MSFALALASAHRIHKAHMNDLCKKAGLPPRTEQEEREELKEIARDVVKMDKIIDDLGM